MVAIILLPFSSHFPLFSSDLHLFFLTKNRTITKQRKIHDKAQFKFILGPLCVYNDVVYNNLDLFSDYISRFIHSRINLIYRIHCNHKFVKEISVVKIDKKIYLLYKLTLILLAKHSLGYSIISRILPQAKKHNKIVPIHDLFKIF